MAARKRGKRSKAPLENLVAPDASEPQPESAVPEYVRQSRTYQKKKVTKRTLPTFTEAMLLIHAPEGLRLFWEALLEGLKARDKHALEMFGEIAAYIRGKGGVNISVTQAMMQQNVAASDTSPVMGYDALVRQIAEARAGHALPPPAEVIDLPADQFRRAEQVAVVTDAG